MSIIALVVYVEQSQRRIPVQYAKRMVGRRTYGGTNTYIPIKVNMAGVVPVIFASSLLYIPALIAQFNMQPNAENEIPGWVSWIETSGLSATLRRANSFTSCGRASRASCGRRRQARPSRAGPC